MLKLQLQIKSKLYIYVKHSKRGVDSDSFYKNTVYFCKVLDLQLSIKNISLSGKNFNERVRWLKGLLKDKELKKAINLVPINKFSSRNDIK